LTAKLIRPLEDYRQFFDFSRFERLELIRFICVGRHSPTRINEVDATIAAVKSLPEEATNLTVSFFFRVDWTESDEFSQQMDSLLAGKTGIIMVEIIPWRPDDQERMRNAFPQLSATRKLQVVRKRAEGVQTFDT
jgi:hypothetical protein